MKTVEIINNELKQSKKEWETMGLEQKRSIMLKYWRDLSEVTRGVDNRRYILNQIFFTKELEIPEIESYLERTYKNIMGGNK